MAHPTNGSVSARVSTRGLWLALAFSVLPLSAIAAPKGGRTATVRAAASAQEAALAASIAAAQGGAPSDARGTAGAPAVAPVPIPTTAPPVPSAVASAVPQPSAAPAPSASSSPRLASPLEVTLRGTLVLRLQLADGGLSAAERVRRATRAIEASISETKIEAVRVEPRGDRAIVFVGTRPVVELTTADAEVAGEGSLELYAASVASRIRDVLQSEERRSQLAGTVFNLTLVVVLALGAAFLIRLLGQLTERLRRAIDRSPKWIPAIRLRSIEVVRPHVLRSGLIVGLSVAKGFAQIAIGYGWLYWTLKLFDATRGAADQLTTIVLSPFSGLAQRLVVLLPMVVLAALSAVVLAVLLRFVALFFAGVERGETELSWLKSEHAAATSVIIRVAVVLLALVLFAPVLTGNGDGPFSRVGMLALVVLGLGLVPLASTAMLGALTLFAGHLRVGERVRIGSAAGRVSRISLTELRLEGPDGLEVRVPLMHLLTRPVELLEEFERLVLTVEVPSGHSIELVLRELRSELTRWGEQVTVELLGLEGGVYRLRAAVLPTLPRDDNAVFLAVARALDTAGQSPKSLLLGEPPR